MKKSKSAGILSTLFMGLGQMVITREYMKGFVFAMIELFTLLKLPFFIQKVNGLLTLGTVTGISAIENDHSLFMMIDGLLATFVIIFFAMIYVMNIKDAISSGRDLDRGGEFLSIQRFIKKFADRSFPYIMLSPTAILISFFSVFPIVYTILLAFTDYSSPNHVPPANLINWVGLDNVFNLFKLPMWNGTFIGVFTWTLIWAGTASVTCYFSGLFVALFINSGLVKRKKLWRTIYILPFSVPFLISALIWRNLLNGQFGPLNAILSSIGVVHPYFGLLKANIAWLSDPTMAKITLLLVNIWFGFPYFMALLTGIMTGIDPSIYEAADIDGADKFKKFKNITLPLVIQATTPLIVMTFASNFNNFGIIYFLNSGGPIGVYDAASGAGATDILITWIYKLTIDRQMYNVASLMSLLIFIIIGGLSAYNFTRTKAFKED